jgi:hypothetical protein
VEFAQSKSRIEQKLKGGTGQGDDEESGSEDKDAPASSHQQTADEDSKRASPDPFSAPSLRADDKSSSVTPTKPVATQFASPDYKKALTSSSPATSSSGTPSSTLEPLRNNMRLAPQALPHHIPKMDALSKKLDDIRKTMGDEVSLG